MAKFIKGDVVVVPFPFSDLSKAKRRPALVISTSTLEGNDLILCQITSQYVKDSYAVSLNDNDFEKGGLKQPSNVRPNRIFTADNHIVLYRVGSLNPDKVNEIVNKIIEIVRS